MTLRLNNRGDPWTVSFFPVFVSFPALSQCLRQEHTGSKTTRLLLSSGAFFSSFFSLFLRSRSSLAFLLIETVEFFLRNYSSRELEAIRVKSAENQWTLMSFTWAQTSKKIGKKSVGNHCVLLAKPTCELHICGLTKLRMLFKKQQQLLICVHKS